MAEKQKASRVARGQQKPDKVESPSTPAAEKVDGHSTPEPANETISESEAAAAESEYTQHDEMQDQINELQLALALANMCDVDPQDKDQAKTLLKEQAEEIKTLRINLKAATVSRDLSFAENAELRRPITRQRREIDKTTGKRTA